jgi:glycosyltransferase involved in cell wall biosynthesis
MSAELRFKVGYVVKRYPRFSETFVVNEILAHEAAGLELEIFSLFPSIDTHFQDAIAWVRAPVTYLPGEGSRATTFWKALTETSALFPGFWSALRAGRDAEAREVMQAVALARMAREKGVRHLHAHFASAPTTVARLAARFSGLTYSFTSHAKDIFHETVQVGDFRQKLNDAAEVVTVSDFNVQHLRQQFGETARHVQRIYNGLDLQRFPYSSPLDRPPQIVAVGRLIEKKGFADLVEACALLAKGGCAFNCQIIGGGQMASMLRSQIQERGLDGFVQLLGPRPQSEAIKMIRGACVLAAPCVVGQDGNRDGLPTVLLEAMALGTPCVSTDVTGIPEVLRHEETGLIVRQHDPSALATAMERLLRDPELRARLAEKARRLIEAEFDVHANSARLRKVFFAASENAGSERQP